METGDELKRTSKKREFGLSPHGADKAGRTCTFSDTVEPSRMVRGCMTAKSSTCTRIAHCKKAQPFPKIEEPSKKAANCLEIL